MASSGESVEPGARERERDRRYGCSMQKQSLPWASTDRVNIYYTGIFCAKTAQVKEKNKQFETVFKRNERRICTTCRSAVPARRNTTQLHTWCTISAPAQALIATRHYHRRVKRSIAHMWSRREEKPEEANSMMNARGRAPDGHVEELSQPERALLAVYLRI